ncbi:MAG: SH3 domain-containing protein [Rhodocyclaceae bacterium]|nr:SH3 domain-containing protein [Rhodocyclaceae bacterium]
MNHRLKKHVLACRRAFGRRARDAAPVVAGMLLTAALATGLSVSFAGDEMAPERRWVAGSPLALRSAPAADAAVIRRLALNTEVELLALAEGGEYCAVAVPGVADGSGYVACRYLAGEPVSRKRIASPVAADGTPNPDYDPQRAFWLAPGYEALKAYGEYLETSRLEDAQRLDPASPRPRDAEFERMKAHLAKGVYGPVPAPYPAWEPLRREAAAWKEERRQIASGRLRKYGTDPAQEVQVAADRHRALRDALGLFDLDVAQALALAGSIELPGVRPSLFRTMEDLSAPGESAEQASGRFRIIHTVAVRGRDPLRGEEGVWDIGSVTKALTRPVIRHTLFRDGRIVAAPTRLADTAIEWSSADGPMCEGHADGFAYGDSDPRIWTGYGLGEDAYRASHATRPQHSLVRFQLRSALPTQQAGVARIEQTLDRNATGFVAATTFFFDLDRDGNSDLAVWEGSGQAAGHLDGPPQTDDAHQRLFFANIAGRWVLLGQDAFSYGCGC